MRKPKTFAQGRRSYVWTTASGRIASVYIGCVSKDCENRIRSVRMAIIHLKKMLQEDFESLRGGGVELTGRLIKSTYFLLATILDPIPFHCSKILFLNYLEYVSLTSQGH